MASLKELKVKIALLSNTQKITKAMRTVSAAKLRKAQLVYSQSQPYADALMAMVDRLGLEGSLELDESPYWRREKASAESQSRVLVVVTADRGLCGAFNTNVLRLARARMQSLRGKGESCRLILIGRKGVEVLLGSEGDAVEGQYPFSDMAAYSHLSGELYKLLDRYAEGKVSGVEVVSNHYVTALSQEARVTPILPLADVFHGEGQGVRAQSAELSQGVITFEPDRASLVRTLLPSLAISMIYRLLLESSVSELASRMAAMDAATRNAGELIKDQTRLYNRTRQALITKELIEIISGAEALRA